MEKHLYLIKLKSGQQWTNQGKRWAVTYLKIPLMVVLRTESEDKRNKQRVLVGIKPKPLAKCKRSQQAFFKKASCTTGFYYLREVQLSPSVKCEVGKNLPVEQIVQAGDWLAVSGRTKGRGFAGVVKRWGFKGGPKTHGQSDRERAIGSIGQRTDPGRVRKGKKMPGHMGNKTKTVKSLSVLQVDGQGGLVVVKGMVPGGKNSLVAVSKLSLKRRQPKGAAFDIKEKEATDKEESDGKSAQESKPEKEDNS